MLWPFAINENKKLLTVKCESLSTGAAEGVWQAQGHRAVHQPVQRWVHADGLRGVPRATGQTERHEQPLGQTGQLAGGVEVFTTGGSHAVSSRCQSMYCNVMFYRAVITHTQLNFYFPAPHLTNRTSMRWATVCCSGWKTSTAGGTRWFPLTPSRTVTLSTSIIKHSRYRAVNYM